jgi:processive 1,2-diacylglycerol beta-glucosyltransferase
LRPPLATDLMRFLILTAAFGDGHNSAATNVSRALSEISAGQAECPVRDAIAEGNPLIAAALQSGYQLAITSLPSIWNFLYRKTETINLTEPPLEFFNGILDWLEAEMQSFRPLAIVSTYPLYANLVRRLNPDIPVYTIITDSISVHRSWTTTPSTLHFVTDEQSRKVAQSFGLPPESIQVSGFPVAPEFTRQAVVPRTELKRLLWVCSTNTRHVQRTLRSLMCHLPPSVSLTIVLGKHADRLAIPIERELGCHGTEREVNVIGWCDHLPQLMFAHDFIITKAGGATTHECFAAGIPMGINYVVPGQEEGNAELAIGSGCAITIEDAANAGPAIQKLMGTGTFAQLANRIAAQGVSDGAFRIARTLLDMHSS